MARGDPRQPECQWILKVWRNACTSSPSPRKMRFANGYTEADDCPWQLAATFLSLLRPRSGAIQFARDPVLGLLTVDDIERDGGQPLSKILSSSSPRPSSTLLSPRPANRWHWPAELHACGWAALDGRRVQQNTLPIRCSLLPYHNKGLFHYSTYGTSCWFLALRQTSGLLAVGDGSIEICPSPQNHHCSPAGSGASASNGGVQAQVVGRLRLFLRWLRRPKKARSVRVGRCATPSHKPQAQKN